MVNVILFPLIWTPIAVLWLLTLFIDSAFLAWLFQFWIVISWAGLFGAHWLGPVLHLLGWLIDDSKTGKFGHFLTSFIFGAGSSVFTILFAGDARKEIKTWYNADDAPSSDFVDNIEDLGDDAEEVGDDIKEDNE